MTTNLERVAVGLGIRTTLEGSDLLVYLKWIHSIEPSLFVRLARSLAISCKERRQGFRLPSKEITFNPKKRDKQGFAYIPEEQVKYPEDIFLASLQVSVMDDEALVSTLKYHFLDPPKPVKDGTDFDEAVERAKVVSLPDIYPFSPPLVPGRKSSTRCPLHDDRRPSFAYFPDTNRFYCFGCSQGGDTIQFMRLMEPDLSFREAVEKIL